MSFFDLKNDKHVVKSEVVYDYRNVSIYNNDISKRTMYTNNKAGVNINDLSFGEQVGAINTFYRSLLPNKAEADVAELTKGKRMHTKTAFYRVSFPNKSPNLTYSKITPSSYTATNLYLFGLLHNNIKDLSVSDDQIIGELVIEHETNSYFSSKAYTCFLLKRSTNEGTNMIDSIIEMANGAYPEKNGLDIDLNKIIPEQTECFFYTTEKPT